jgi:hypothetical protein
MAPEASLDPQGDARQALDLAVRDYGPRVLSNPSLLGNLFKDLLPGSPTESSLLVAAAEGGAASMLEQQVAGVGADSAVRSIAGSLAQERALDPQAALWAVGEMARAMGYPVSQGLQASLPAVAAQTQPWPAEPGATLPIAGQGPPLAAAAPAGPAGAPPFGSGGASAGSAPIPPPPGGPPAAPPPGAPPVGPPSGGPPGFPPTGGPVVPPITWGGGTATPPGPRRGGLGALIAALVAVVIVGGYLGIAAAAKIAPFSAAVITPTPTPRPSHSPTTAPTPTPAAAAQLLLGNNLVFKGSCTAATSEGALAETDPNYDAVIIVINCTTPSLPSLYGDFSKGDYNLGDCSTAQSLADCMPTYITGSASACTDYSSADYVNANVSGERYCDLSGAGNPEDYALVVAFPNSADVISYYADLLTENGMGAAQGDCASDQLIPATGTNAAYCERTYTNSGSGNQGDFFEWETPNR